MEGSCVKCAEVSAVPPTSLAARVATNSTANGCAALYTAVDNCMKARRGQVRECKAEWAAFRRCHAKPP